MKSHEWRITFRIMAVCALACSAHGNAANLDARVKERLDRVAEQYCEQNSYCQALFKLGTGEWRLEEPNLAPNHGFEEVDDKGIPKGWGRTSRHNMKDGSAIDTIAYPKQDERFGARSGRIKTEGNAYYLLAVPGIKSGESYYARADAKLSLTEGGMMSDARVFMQVGWYGTNGWIRGAGIDCFSADLQCRDAWENMGTVAIAPSGANRAQVFLRVENMRMNEEEALFDNVSFHRIIRER